MPCQHWEEWEADKGRPLDDLPGKNGCEIVVAQVEEFAAEVVENTFKMIPEDRRYSWQIYHRACFLRDSFLSDCVSSGRREVVSHLTSSGVSIS